MLYVMAGNGHMKVYITWFFQWRLFVIVAMSVGCTFMSLGVCCLRLAGQKDVKPVMQPEGLLKSSFQWPRMGGIYAQDWFSISI
jgi:hypothetical protein